MTKNEVKQKLDEILEVLDSIQEEDWINEDDIDELGEAIGSIENVWEDLNGEDYKDIAEEKPRDRFEVVAHECREIGDYTETTYYYFPTLEEAREEARKIADRISDVYGMSYVIIYDTEDDEEVEIIEGKY